MLSLLLRSSVSEEKEKECLLLSCLKCGCLEILVVKVLIID